jgi:two-component system, NtrC family, response regulator AtoC
LSARSVACEVVQPAAVEGALGPFEETGGAGGERRLEFSGVEPPDFEPGVMPILQRYRWPGNIRELRNFAENTVVMKRGGKLTEYDLDPKFLDPSGQAPPGQSALAQNPLSVEENEKRLLRNALVQAKGNRTQAAKLLGMSRRTLHRKLHQWPDLDVR